MMSAITIILLHKAASDNGFDLSLNSSGNWLSFASSHAPIKLWLTTRDQSQFVAAFSDSELAIGLSGLPLAIQLDLPTDLPTEASIAFLVTDVKLLYPLLRRAFQLSRSLPNEPLREFKKTTIELPRSTEAERLIIQRVGQDIFRGCLLDYWDGKCAVTGLSITALLKASHIKPWKDCDTDAERLDVFNGLLLAPHLDAAFDKGYITFENNGSITISSFLDDLALRILGIDKIPISNGLNQAHWKYLKWHREKIFIK